MFFYRTSLSFNDIIVKVEIDMNNTVTFMYAKIYPVETESSIIKQQKKQHRLTMLFSVPRRVANLWHNQACAKFSDDCNMTARTAMSSTRSADSTDCHCTTRHMTYTLCRGCNTALHLSYSFNDRQNATNDSNHCIIDVGHAFFW